MNKKTVDNFHKSMEKLFLSVKDMLDCPCDKSDIQNPNMIMLSSEVTEKICYNAVDACVAYLKYMSNFHTDEIEISREELVKDI